MLMLEYMFRRQLGSPAPYLRRCKMDRDQIKNMLPEARIAVERLYLDYIWGNLRDLPQSEKISEFVDKVAMEFQGHPIHEYWDNGVGALLSPVSEITVFANDEHWNDDASPLLDWRHGCEIIPRGVWGVGFITRERAMVSAVLPARSRDGRREKYRTVLNDALLNIGDLESDVDRLIDKGYIEIEEYSSPAWDDSGE